MTERIGFAYTSDWSHEFRAVREGRAPRHRLFGAASAEALGVDVVTAPSSRRPQWNGGWRWKVRQGLWFFVHQRQVDAVICTTEGCAPPLLLLRLVGLLKTPVLVVGVALATERYQRSVYKALFRRADGVIVYASKQIDVLRRRLGPTVPIRFAMFGVDTDFFCPDDSKAPGFIDVLSAGTNPGKDFPTLVAAVGDRVTVIITDAVNQASIKPVPPNIELRSDVPIQELRTLYAAASCVVIPLRESAESSGQTVLLECLAMGKRVVVSHVSGIADYLDRDVVHVVPAGDIAALRAALDCPAIEPSDSIRRWVQEHCEERQLARQLLDAARSLA